MISEAIRILDEGDAKLQIEKLHEELDQAIKEKEQIQTISQRQAKELIDIKKENDRKDSLIEELKRQIEHLKRQSPS